MLDHFEDGNAGATPLLNAIGIAARPPMPRIQTLLGVVLAGIPGLLAAPSARAASLQQVSNWGASGVPSDVSMYIYVPDRVATTPPILTLIHYCGGTAPAVFGQAQGGGIVSAADQYGFIMVVPSSGRCWDVAVEQDPDARRRRRQSRHQADGEVRASTRTARTQIVSMRPETRPAA